MYRLIILIFILIITSCKAQIKKHTSMDTFDIKTFDKHKDHLSRYNYIRKDSTVVEQRTWQFGYEEVIMPKNNLIHIFNKYNEDGKLMLTGDFFPNDFEKGIWKEYDEQGNLIKETNYDTPYKFTWEEVLEWIKERNINMESDYFEIYRNAGEEEGEKPIWAITWEKEDKSSLRVAILDGSTGKVQKEIDQEYPLDE